MVTSPSSSGWRSASRTWRRNSGSSSRKSTPWCASETSPGRGMLVPPTRPASEMEWCGARKGRSARRPRSRSSPATLWTTVASSASSKPSAGRMPGSRRASMVFPLPGGPKRSRLWPPAAAISRARLAASCPATSARSSAAGGSRRRGGGRRARRQRPAARATPPPPRGAAPGGREPLDDRGLERVRLGHHESPAPRPAAPRWRAGGRRAPASPRRRARARPPGGSPRAPRTGSPPRPPAGPPRWAGRTRCRPCADRPGARFTVTRFCGSFTPMFRSAASTRTFASCTALAGAAPPGGSRGMPCEVSTSTSTGTTFTPSTAPERTRTSMHGRSARGVPRVGARRPSADGRANRPGPPERMRDGRQVCGTDGARGGCRQAPQRASATARASTASSICGVSRPVCVFCCEGW